MNFSLMDRGMENSHDTASNGHLDKYTKTKEVQAYEQYRTSLRRGGAASV